MNSLILLRGLPGSGKSTLAKELSESGKHPVFSIDDYFTSAEGEYRFEFEKNHLAYKNCELNTNQAMQSKATKIFIDNVFSLEWEMEPYFKMAAEFNYRVFVLTVENRHHNKNIHHVSDDQIKRMAEKYKVVLL
ncbi:MAG: ATP-binding protein [Bacteroidetes bacterium]|nr:ATP-binding protein [Bacteroidota bacterium]